MPRAPLTPRRPFTPAEDARLEEMRIDGASLGKIALALGRPKSSIYWRLNWLADQDDIAA